MSHYRQQVIEYLGIDIDLFLQKMKIGASELGALEQEILYQSLLGDSRKQIATRLGLSSEQVRDRLGDYIYPGMAHLIPMEPGEKAGNWAKILNFLLNPQNGYRLNPTPQLNSDNFQASFGRQIFLYPTHRAIVQSQVEASQFYQQGLYYAALQCFWDAWQQEKEIYQSGNAEILIYINNNLVEYKRSLLQEKGVQIYTIAVVVPFHHNQGRIAAEILRGVAQIQSQINFSSFNRLSLLKELNLNIMPGDRLTALSPMGQPIALRVLIVNDPNNLYDPFNQTAEKLANLASQLNLIAIVGHYSSEMTQKALQFYSKQGIPLINASSTANSLSHLSKGEQLSFFRLTTQDQINGAALAQYLVQAAAETPRRVAIIYNKNSQYSTSYRTTVKEYLDRYGDRFIFLEECGDLSERFEYIQSYLKRIQTEKVEIIILIPDGGIEPNSLNNTGLISRLNLQHCLIAGSATFYQENILHWMHERSQLTGTSQAVQPLVACVPWHWHSVKNGYQSANSLAQSFCQLGSQLWGEENLTWRSATAFDAVLVILRVLEQYSCSDSQSLLVCLNQYFKEQQKQMQGVTGQIQFHPNGDRINPPTEILTVAPSLSAENRLNWRWLPLDLGG